MIGIALTLTILDLIGKFLTSVCGAGFGATAAYYFAKNRQAEEEKSKNYGDAIAAFYILVARYSALENFARKYLNNSRDNIAPNLSLHLLYQHCPNESISLRPLAFMADSKDADFIHGLSISEAKYFNFTDALKERNIDVRVVIKSALTHGSKLDEPIGVNFPHQAEVDFAVLQNENLARAALAARDNLAEEIKKFAEVLHRRFPKKPRLTAIPISE